MNQERLTNINKRSVSVVLRDFSNSEHLEKALDEQGKSKKKEA